MIAKEVIKEVSNNLNEILILRNKKTQKQIKKTVKRKKELNDAKEIYDIIK
mgnify:CR=1 FL=1